MNLNTDKQRLQTVLRMFYWATGIGIGVYSITNEKISLFPDEHGPLCAIMRNNPVSCRECERCDFEAFERCQESGEIQIYTCHAGLTDVFAPINDENNNIIGYISFGQLAGCDDRKTMIKTVQKAVDRYKLKVADDFVVQCVKKLKYRSYGQLIAMAGIMEICACFLSSSGIVRANKDEFIFSLEKFIETHIKEKITVDLICKSFAMSRTNFYIHFKKCFRITLSEYIIDKRISLAKKLLLRTTLSIDEIAKECGFKNHNYFCTVFKTKMCITPKMYQQISQS